MGLTRWRSPRLVFPDVGDVEDFEIAGEQEEENGGSEGPEEELDGQRLSDGLGDGGFSVVGGVWIGEGEEESAGEADAGGDGEGFDGRREAGLPGAAGDEEGAAEQGVDREDGEDKGGDFGEFAEH